MVLEEVGAETVQATACSNGRRCVHSALLLVVCTRRGRSRWDLCMCGTLWPTRRISGHKWGRDDGVTTGLGNADRQQLPL